MFQDSPAQYGFRAHILDDAELTVRQSRRGTRQLGQGCRLTIALNGDACLELEEEAGDRAPRELVVDVCTRSACGPTLLLALATRPWAGPDGPVIMFADAGNKGEVGYLIRTAEITQILEIIREALDLEVPGGWRLGMPETPLDAAAGGG
jgi:hypothetical protein